MRVVYLIAASFALSGAAFGQCDPTGANAQSAGCFATQKAPLPSNSYLLGWNPTAPRGQNTKVPISAIYSGGFPASITNLTMTGYITETSNRTIGGTGGFPYLASNAFLFEQIGTSGTVSGTLVPLNLLANSDNIINTTSGGGVAMLRIESTTQAGIKGDRSGIDVIQTLGAASANGSGTNVFGGVFGAAARSGDGGTATLTGARGSLQALNAQARVYGGSQYLSGVFGAEFNATIEGGSSAAYKVGAMVVQLATDSASGTFDDVGLSFNNALGGTAPGWDTVIGIGSKWAGLPIKSSGTILKVQPNTLTPSLSQSVSMGNGIDIFDATFSGSAWISKNSAITGTGYTYAAGLQTMGTLAATTASISAVQVVDGGVFTTKPTLTVAAPPSGVTAIAAVATMGLSTRQGYGVRAIVTGGSGYVAGNVLTVSGGTGTPPTIHVDTVDGSGAVLTATVQSQGSLSVLPSNPASVTGGSGTGATFTLNWTILTGTVSVAGSGYAEVPFPRISAGLTQIIAPDLRGTTSGAAAILSIASANITSGDGSFRSTGVTGDSSISANAQAGFLRSLQMMTSGTLRWVAGANSTAEAGANAGSDFILSRYSDAGSLLGTALTVTRSSGNASWANNVTFASSGSAPITISSGAITVASGQNLSIVTGGAANTVSIGNVGAGIGQALIVTSGAGGNTAGAANPNTVHAPNLMKAAFYQTNGASYALSGSQSRQPLLLQTSYSGATTGMTSGAYQFDIPSDALDVTGAANAFAGMTITQNVGSGAKGGRITLAPRLNINGAITGDTTTQQYQPFYSDARASVNVGGTNTGSDSKGYLYGSAAQAILQSGATNWTLINGGGEYDIAVNTGATVRDVVGMSIVSLSTHAVAGSRINTMLAFGAQVGAAATWTSGISHGGPDGPWVIASSGSLIQAEIQTACGNAARTCQMPPRKATYGTDWQSVNFSQQSGYSFRGPGFSADGTGQARVQNGILGVDANGIILDVPAQRVTAIAVAAGGGGGGSGTNDYYATDILTDGYGGQYSITVAAGAVATLTTLVPGVSTSPPANPVALSGGSGSGATANLTWGAKNQITVGTSGGPFVVSGPFGTATPVTKTNDFTVAAGETTFIVNKAGSVTTTLPSAASYCGRHLVMRTITANTVVSASSNVVPLAGGAAGTAILAATAGKWAWLQSDCSNWQIIASN